MRNDLAALFRADGPFVSVYLDARSEQARAQQQLRTRWKTVRSSLAAEGATDDDLAALDGAVEAATHIGATRSPSSPPGGRCSCTATCRSRRRETAAAWACFRGSVPC